MYIVYTYLQIYTKLNLGVIYGSELTEISSRLVLGYTGKTLSIRRIAVRETCVYLHIGTQLRSPLKNLGPSQHCRIEGFKEGSLHKNQTGKSRLNYSSSNSL